MKAVEVIAGLYQGGFPESAGDLQGYDAIVNLSGGSYPIEAIGESVPVLDWHIPDGEMSDGATVRAIAKYVCALVLSNKRVLVHCGAGINRSGLVTARVLMELGMRPQAAIEKVRAAKPDALQNSHFVAWLMGGG